ncbi:hypothetical protein Leryth_001617 [Lithospermum erythrorhizon]|nr:hypothetical protein Leryth_001617 [Lithospermum erythrorhizon]
MNNCIKNAEEVRIQLPETNLATENGTMSGPLVGDHQQKPRIHRKNEMLFVGLRFLCLTTSVVSMSLMVSAKQDSTISIFGFSIPVHSKWSFSDSFEYLVGVSAAVAVHSILQLLIGGSRLVRKCSIISSRSEAWVVFAGDQIFAFAMMSAGSAASGVTNLNRTGIHHSSLPNFCNSLRSFCDRVAVSIAFTFFSCFLLATSVLLDVMWLSQY